MDQDGYNMRQKVIMAFKFIIIIVLAVVLYMVLPPRKTPVTQVAQGMAAKAKTENMVIEIVRSASDSMTFVVPKTSDVVKIYTATDSVRCYYGYWKKR